MQCPNCHSPLEDGAVFCGNCGAQIAPRSAQGATSVSDGTVIMPERSVGANTPNVNTFGNAANANTFGNTQQAPQPGGITSMRTAQEQKPQQGQNPYATVMAQGPDYRGATPLPATTTPAPTPPPFAPRRGNRRTLIIVSVLVLLAVIVVSAGVFALTRKPSTSTNTNIGGKTGTTGNTGAATNAPGGTVAFLDGHNNGTDSLSMTLANMKAPASGSQYFAWLIDQATEHVTPLGQLNSSGQNQPYTLNFAGNGQNLLSLGNSIEITQEQGSPVAPTGQVVLKGTFPPQAFVHIKHLLFHFGDTPHNIGLLVGLRDQTQKLDEQALLLKNANNPIAVRCYSQAIVDIIEGHHSHQLAADCAALNIQRVDDGYGLLGTGGYVANAAAHAGFAANAADATPNIKLHAGHVGIAVSDVRDWVTTIDKDAIALTQNQTLQNNITEIAQLADKVLHGVPGPDGQVLPVQGQAGALTAYQHGQFMAALQLA